MNIKYIQEKNIVTFLFGRYLKIIQCVETEDAEELYKACNNNIVNYDKIYIESGMVRLYRDLGFFRGVLHSLGLLDIEEDELQFNILLNSINNQGPENLY